MFRPIRFQYQKLLHAIFDQYSSIPPQITYKRIQLPPDSNQSVNRLRYLRNQSFDNSVIPASPPLDKRSFSYTNINGLDEKAINKAKGDNFCLVFFSLCYINIKNYEKSCKSHFHLGRFNFIFKYQNNQFYFNDFKPKVCQKRLITHIT